MLEEVEGMVNYQSALNYAVAVQIYSSVKMFRRAWREVKANI